MTRHVDIVFALEPLPASQDEALQWLLPLVAAGSRRLCKMPVAAFKRGWFAIGFLYPGLHPDAALEHGREVSELACDEPDMPGLPRQLIAPFYVKSGWPVALAPVAAEAWRRYEAGDLREEEFYCSEAVIAGMCCRIPALARAVREERRTRKS